MILPRMGAGPFLVHGVDGIVDGLVELIDGQRIARMPPEGYLGGPVAAEDRRRAVQGWNRRTGLLVSVTGQTMNIRRLWRTPRAGSGAASIRHCFPTPFGLGPRRNRRLGLRAPSPKGRDEYGATI